MKNINDLHFISFETAKILEQVGYDEQSLVVYRYKNDLTNPSPELMTLGAPKKNIHLKEYSTVAALTFEETIDYIIERFHFCVSCTPVVVLSRKTGKPLSFRWKASITRLKIGVRSVFAEGIDYYDTLDIAIRKFLYDYIISDKDKVKVTPFVPNENEMFVSKWQEELSRDDYTDLEFTNDEHN